MYREVTMKTIEDHIEHDKELIADPSTSEPMKRHATEMLEKLENRKEGDSGFFGTFFNPDAQ